MAFIKHQVEREEVQELEGHYRKVILDNQIDDHESELAGSFLKELVESAMASMSLAIFYNGENTIKNGNTNKKEKSQ